MDRIINDLQAAHNLSGNATAPFNQTEAVAGLMKSWARGEDLYTFAIFLSVSLFYVTIATVRYTSWRVITSLAVVETPHILVLEQQDSSSKHNSSLEYSSRLTRQTTTTSSVRATLRLLYSQGGILSLWRGFAMLIAYNVLFGLIMACIELIFKFLIRMCIWCEEEPRLGPWLLIRGGLEQIIAVVILANFSLAYTHIIITKPSFKIWYRRLPSLRTWKDVWIPTAAYDLAQWLTFSLPNLLLILSDSNREGNLKFLLSPQLPWVNLRISSLGIWIFAQVLRFKLLIPMKVALTRVEASLLSDDEEPLVLINRYYNGRISGILSPSRALDLGEAWRSFSQSDKARLYKLFAKFILFEALVRSVAAIFLGFDALEPGNYWNPNFW